MQTKNFQTSKLGLEKAEEPERSNSQHLLNHRESKGIPEKHLGLLHRENKGFTLKPLTVWNHDKLWKALKEMGIPDHLPCLLRNLYVDQEATVRTLYGTTDWFKIEKARSTTGLSAVILCLTCTLSTS